VRRSGEANTASGYHGARVGVDWEQPVTSVNQADSLHHRLGQVSSAYRGSEQQQLLLPEARWRASIAASALELAAHIREFRGSVTAAAPPPLVLLDGRGHIKLRWHVTPRPEPVRRKPKLPSNLSPQHLQVLRDIRDRGLLHKGETLLLAVSGSQVRILL
jgi:hypothetical protein